MRTQFSNIIDLANEYITQLEGTYLNQSVTIGSSAMIFDVYVVAPTTSITSSIMTGCSRNDANSQLIVGNNLSVADNEILTPPYRCKGLFIVSAGKFINRGTISMTARGASAAGVNIPLIDDKFVSAVGGAGGARTVAYSRSNAIGNSGSSPAEGVISCGGGGGGGANACAGSSSETSAATGGSGSSGTSFSGGSGGGAACRNKGTGTTGDGQPNGGAGGRGWVASTSYSSRGGAGNPIGQSTLGSSAFTADTNGTGTGGLLVLASPTITNLGTIESEGSQGPGYTAYSSSTTGGGGGGASGGGCICLIADTFSVSQGTISTEGGAQSYGGCYVAQYGYASGGAGGAGTSIQIDLANTPIGNITTPIHHISAQSQYSEDVPIKNGQLLFNTDQSGLYYDWDFVRRSVGNNWETYN